MKNATVICLVLAFIAALFYFLMGAGFITVPALNTTDAPATIVYVAGGCYVLGGLLILLRKRWLWIIGLFMNTLVIFIFVSMYIQKPEVMFSLPGLGTKIAQLLLEAGLIYLIATYKKSPGLASTP
jgi:hypothetical protein